MKRRGFFKFLGMLAVAPVAIAKAIEHAKEPQRPMYILTGNAKRFDWSAAQPFNPATSKISYSEYADAGRMPTYEGVVYGGDGTRLWRFDVVSESNFKCRNCDTVMAFNREDFRQHGQSCNHKLEEYKS